MTRQELIDLCLSFAEAYEDHPFDALAKGNRWTAMRHTGNKKCFALISELDGRLCVNLKCDPLKADFLRQAFRDVRPGFHMNKTHWNTVFPGGDVPEAALVRMIGHSYDLTQAGRRK